MEFEWDKNKALKNYTKHRVTFEFITRLFFEDKNLIIVEDERYNYGETRFYGLGEIEKRVYVVVFTIKEDNVIRIISARKGNKREQKKYHSLRTKY